MRVPSLVVIVSAVSFSVSSLAQSSGTLGLQDGFLNFSTPTFNVQLVKDSQTLYSLQTKSNGSSGGFDFIPSDVMPQRQSNGNYHLGDLTFRARVVGSSAWTSGDTAVQRHNVAALSATRDTLAAANLSPTLSGTPLLNITRRWVLNNGDLELLFDVTNSQKQAVEIGALGAPLEFNNVSVHYTLLPPTNPGSPT
ncbi:hypothetical protein NUW54_g11357 [Trametes sanguinea]|uniref:Uncharacterized protein n=1 Tax=Trametes sanguinea TaxID=158606 RepID=A0ACC1NF67_9APHY|nr:hypothetical protein NUW54_g11357 [Trametes sanguinea]